MLLTSYAVNDCSCKRCSSVSLVLWFCSFVVVVLLLFLILCTALSRVFSFVLLVLVVRNELFLSTGSVIRR